MPLKCGKTPSPPRKTLFSEVMFRAAAAAVAAVMLISGCATTTDIQRNELSFWRSAARQNHLAGGSLAEFTRLYDTVAGDKLKHQLPDLLRMIESMPPEKAAESAVNILNECILAASTWLLPQEAEISLVSRQMYGRTLDWQSAAMLAEKDFLENIIWKTPAQYARENDLNHELAAFFGTVPPPGCAGLAAVQELPVSPMPELTAKYFGRDPAALLHLGSLLLAMPGEFARQLAAAPETKFDGVWREMVRVAALSALHITEKELAGAAAAYKNGETPANLYNFRRWYYLRENILSTVPIMRGSPDDINSVESMFQLHKM